MIIRNPIIKHGLSEIRNAVQAEFVAESRKRLSIELEKLVRKKKRVVTLEELVRIIGTVFEQPETEPGPRKRNRQQSRAN